MEVLTAPICRLWARMTVKDCKKTLSANPAKRGNEDVGIFHCVSCILSVSGSTCIFEILRQIRRWTLEGKLRQEPVVGIMYQSATVGTGNLDGTMRGFGIAGWQEVQGGK